MKMCATFITIIPSWLELSHCKDAIFTAILDTAFTIVTVDRRFISMLLFNLFFSKMHKIIW